MTDDPAGGRAAQEGLVGGAGGGGGPRRPGVGDGERRATPARPWPAPSCAWAGSRGWPGRPSPPSSPCPAPSPPSCSTGGPTPTAPPPGWCSSPRWGPCSPPQRFKLDEPRVALLSIGEEPSKGNALVKETHALLAAARVPARRGPVHRQRRGPRRAVRPGRRGRHRRLHRQRGAQDPRGRRPLPHRHRPAGDDLHRGGHGRPPRCCCPSSCPSTPSSTPTPTAGPCSSASTACASSATARRRGGPSSTPSGWPGRWSWRTWSAASGRPWPRLSDDRRARGRPRSQAHKRGNRYHRTVPSPHLQERLAVPADTRPRRRRPWTARRSSP